MESEKVRVQRNAFAIRRANAAFWSLDLATPVYFDSPPSGQVARARNGNAKSDCSRRSLDSPGIQTSARWTSNGLNSRRIQIPRFSSNTQIPHQCRSFVSGVQRGEITTSAPRSPTACCEIATRDPAARSRPKFAVRGTDRSYVDGRKSLPSAVRDLRMHQPAKTGTVSKRTR